MSFKLTSMSLPVLLSYETAVASASPPAAIKYSRSYDACIAQAEGSDPAMSECLLDELDIQDAKLNQTYKLVMRRLTQPKKIELRNLQRAWIVKRDRQCERAAAPEQGGTLYLILYRSCLVDETLERTRFLENY
ncbi:DUF1311 domain-containing protein [Sphingorhabdus pulchriflava]|uniref:DUF1311 domain-containing protein n=1 Tax=Sphingorhabdus pulchriflava TaxID=2292257 RepID=A0A371BIK0_9SPHN|nr:lysozyme inhibitor LprI family protein [Sphingorhabdus pulchriflava]RDV07385.1 DUF1311 domain-containing protein [Sphingorhabdus pulchriflava]